VHDAPGDRTGSRPLTREVERPSPTTVVTAEARPELRASGHDPAAVAATGTHHRRTVCTDGITTVDTRRAERGTASAFHATIDLQVEADGRAHQQRRWVRTLPRLVGAT
jgi:hypothetical protein